MPATLGSRRAAVRNVPLVQLPSVPCFDPSERGKNSYQLPKPARVRSTRTSSGRLSVVRLASGDLSISALTRGSSATVNRAAGERLLVPITLAASVRTLLAGSFFTARARRSMPISSMSLTSMPAGILISALCSQVAQSSFQACTLYTQVPCRSSRTSTSHRSNPSPTSCIRYFDCTPPGVVRSRSTPRMSCPSVKTVAWNGTTSPTKAFAGQLFSGCWGARPRIGMRPIFGS